MSRLKPFLLIFVFIPIAYSLDNGLAKLPPMGWMSWSRFFCETDCEHNPHACINEELYQQHADRLVADGYKKAGYTHIHIDDCWSEHQRGPDGRLIPDHARFPSGIPALVDYMHKRGLKLGIYGDVGEYTCAGYPGSQHYVDIDAQTLADWNVDYYKFDGCNSTIPDLRETYQKFQKALNKTGKKIIYSCEWPLYEHEKHASSNYTAISSTCNVFRNYHDVANEWSSVLDIIEYYVNNQDSFIPYNGPGSWFDPDMLVIGNNLTVQESRTQFGVWAIWSAPLIMSNDLRNISSDLRKVLQTASVIAVDQDKLGKMGKMVKSSNNFYAFVKPMTPFYDHDNTSDTRVFSYAFLLMNKGESSLSVSITLTELGLNNKAGYNVTDLWTGKDLGTMTPKDTYSSRIEAHDSLIFKATAINAASANRSFILWCFCVCGFLLMAFD